MLDVNALMVSSSHVIKYCIEPDLLFHLIDTITISFF
jgi:hypothetical protein